MSGLDTRRRAALHHLAADLAAATGSEQAAVEAEATRYREAISQGIDAALARLNDRVVDLTLDNDLCRRLVEQATEYVSWMQWALWDLPYLAVALRPPLEEFRRAVTGCGLVYISIRVFDDIIDRHYWYKGRQPTLLNTVTARHDPAQGAEGLTLLGGLLICFAGLRALAEPAGPPFDAMLATLLDAVQRAVIGAIMEQSDVAVWDATTYDRLVQLKNVDYWRATYAALDPEERSPLFAFLVPYYELAQNLNDVQDFAEDRQRGQPNLLNLYLAGNGRASACLPLHGRPAVAPPAVESLLADKFLALAERAAALPPTEKLVAHIKVAESLANAFALGLFAEPAPPPPDYPDEPVYYPLTWYDDIGRVVEVGGSDALEEVACSVCGDDGRRPLFHKQGFPFYRCLNCGHIYVTPRITPDLLTTSLQSLDGENFEDRYLEIQKLYAESICDLLQKRTRGPRLLDVGFGRGYVLQLAQAFGFDVYGVDSSRFQVDQLHPQFGDRLLHLVVGREEIPWDSFDVVVMSHVLEHMPDPAAVLRDLHGRLHPGGLLYVAVPDMESLHFRIFGKTWDAVNPLVHMQYFTAGSLERLLERCGFEGAERIYHPGPPNELAPRWLRLMRQLGGSDAPEIALLARVPGGDG